MKKYLLIIFGITILFSCSKKDNDSSITSCSKDASNYSDTSGITFNITKETWFLIRYDDGGGSVNMMLAGKTNGDSAKIRTSGDGVFTYLKLNMDTAKKFDSNIEISFSYGSVNENEFNENTNIMVFKGNDTLNVPLESCTLKY
ncbi:MAG TPA: hypothetical protein PKK00_05460 [Bacteroidales bacterium]|nr:hypothetical protein [Bacteroidales bacterium]HPS17574.1 hypothetical protein [Bacteroidales bacterium]